MQKVMLIFVFLLVGCTLQPIMEAKPFKRVALVIGNQNYVDNALNNPINDATSMAKTLSSIGFEVTLKLDTTLHEFNQALEEIAPKIESNNTILFIYFAGHGNTLEKASAEQYLMMTNKEKKVLVSIYKLYDFLSRVDARHNIVVIDACRDYQEHYIPMQANENEKMLNNYRGNFRAGIIRYEDGIKIDENVVLDNNYSYLFPKSTILSYATDLYQRAKDWSIYDAQHSPYSYALIHYLDDEEIPIEEVFRRVRTSLLNETDRKQSNSEKTNLEKNIWLVPKRAEVAFAPPI